MSEIPRKCDCKYCTVESPLIKRIKAALTEEDNILFDEMMNGYFHESLDANYYSCIFDGSWPNSVEILRSAADRIEKADENKLLRVAEMAESDGTLPSQN